MRIRPVCQHLSAFVNANISVHLVRGAEQIVNAKGSRNTPCLNSGESIGRNILQMPCIL